MSTLTPHWIIFMDHILSYVNAIGAFVVGIMAVRTIHELKSAVKADPDFQRDSQYLSNKIVAYALIFWAIFIGCTSCWKITMYYVIPQHKEAENEKTMRCLQRVRQTDDDVLVRPNCESNSLPGMLEREEDRSERPAPSEGVMSRPTEDVG